MALIAVYSHNIFLTITWSLTIANIVCSPTGVAITFWNIKYVLATQHLTPQQIQEWYSCLTNTYSDMRHQNVLSDTYRNGYLWNLSCIYTLIHPLNISLFPQCGIFLWHTLNFEKRHFTNYYLGFKLWNEITYFQDMFCYKVHDR